MSIIVFIDGPSLEALNMLGSKRRQQIYPAWELVTVIDGTIPQGDAIKSFLARQRQSAKSNQPLTNSLDRIKSSGDC